MRFPVRALLCVPSIGMHGTDEQITRVNLTMIMTATYASRMLLWRWFLRIGESVLCFPYHLFKLSIEFDDGFKHILQTLINFYANRIFYLAGKDLNHFSDSNEELIDHASH